MALSRGVILCATNSDKYISMATDCIESLREVNYPGKILLITDLALEKDCFNRARTIPNVILLRPAAPELCNPKYISRYFKTAANEYSPFDESLFLDADIIAKKPFDEIWSYLSDEKPVWMVKDIHNFTPPGITPRRPKGVPLYNGGLVLWRTSKKAHDWFRMWNKEWLETQSTDQPPLIRAQAKLGFIANALSSNYNTIFNTPNTIFWHKMGGK